MKYKHIKIEKTNESEWFIYDKSNEYLGAIIWYKPWKQYCLDSELSIWAVSCLTDIIDFIKNLPVSTE